MVEGNYNHLVEDRRGSYTIRTLSEEAIVSEGIAVDEWGNVYVVARSGLDSHRQLGELTGSATPAGRYERNCLLLRIDSYGNHKVVAEIPGVIDLKLVYSNHLIYALSQETRQLFEISLHGQVALIAGPGSPYERRFNSFNPVNISFTRDGQGIYVISADQENVNGSARLLLIEPAQFITAASHSVSDERFRCGPFNSLEDAVESSYTIETCITGN